MIRFACLVDISVLLRGGLERGGCIVGQKGRRNASHERTHVCQGQRPSELWALYDCCSPDGSLLRASGRGESEALPWLVLISHNEGNHHKCHLAFWSGSCRGRTDESPTSAFNRASLLTVTQSRPLNRTLGFHADTEGTRHGWESQRRKNSQSWQCRRSYVILGQRFNVNDEHLGDSTQDTAHSTIQCYYFSLFIVCYTFSSFYVHIYFILFLLQVSSGFYPCFYLCLCLL